MLVINPGSTSTKVSVFDDGAEVFTRSVFHDAPQLLEYPTTNDQLPFRKGVVLDLLQEHGIDIASIDVFVGRGGCAYSQSEGVMVIDERLVKDTMDDVGGSDHPAKLGVMMAYDFGKRYGKPMYTVDPTNVDELAPPARITGLKGVYRRAQSHVLNQKGIARLHAAKLTPTRLGGIPVMEVARYLETHEPSDLEAMCSRSGGFVSHFATSSADRVHEMKENGDEHATLVWDAMVYQIAKAIGSMACVLSGKVDAILLTGGLVGEAEAHVYTGRPVFGGFGWE